MSIDHSCDNHSRKEVDHCLCDSCLEEIKIEQFKLGREDYKNEVEAS